MVAGFLISAASLLRKHMIDPELTIRKLEIFLAFMEKRNIARTAETLGISGVSVHRALHSLEEVLRCPLFAQDGRNLKPLPAAQTLAHYADEMLIVLRRAIDAATRNAAGYGSGRMKLGCLYSLTTETVPRLIMGLKRRRPEMEIDLSMNSSRELLLQLADGLLDAILVSLPGDRVEMAGLETLPLFEDTFYLAVPLSMSERIAEPADLADLQHEKFVTMNEGFATAQRFDDAFREAGFRPVVVTPACNDIFSLMNMVQAWCRLFAGAAPYRQGIRKLGTPDRAGGNVTASTRRSHSCFRKTASAIRISFSLLAEARMLAHPPQD